MKKRFPLLLLLATCLPAISAEDIRQEIKEWLAKLEAQSRKTEQAFAEAKEREMDSVLMCDGRLTTQSGVPVSTTDRTAQSTIYFTPVNGNRISLYDGSKWKFYAFSEVSLVLSGLTISKNYDVFIWDNGGVLTLELSAAWTNDTTRADAVTTQDGVVVKSGSATRRYLGTLYTTSTTTTEDSNQRRLLWNSYNQVERTMLVKDTTNSWSYTSTTIRTTNNTTANNQMSNTVGFSGEGEIFLMTYLLGVSNNSLELANGIDAGGTTAFDSVAHGTGGASSYTTASQGAYRHRRGNPGYLYHTWVESGNTNATSYGNAGDASGRLQSGVIGIFRD